MLNDRHEPFQSVTDPAAALVRQTRRTRRSPFTHLVGEHGVKAWTVYNHMLLPGAIHGLEEDYRHLKTAVQVWDVAAERQVEIEGLDAARLVQWMTPRRVADAPVLTCLYAPVCDENGGLLNDPLLLRPDERRWWVSIADTDVLLWAKGLAAGAGLDVTVREPDVHPLAVQGPRADELMARVFGAAVTELKFFRAGVFEGPGGPHVVARCGWSGQGGFEVFVEGWERCEPLWNALFEAGGDLDVGVGCPNGIERIEAGLLSYGNDMTIHDTPFEAGLGRYVDLEADSLAAEALRARGEPTRMLRGLVFDEGPLPHLVQRWRIVGEDGADGAPGHVTSAAHSPDFGRGIAIAMVRRDLWEPGTRVSVDLPGGEERGARVAALPLKSLLPG